MAPTKSNPRRIVRDTGELTITPTDITDSPPKRNSERLASQKRKDDIVSKMAEIFEDVAPMESSSVVAVPVSEDQLQMPACEDEPLPDITLMPVARREPSPVPVTAVAGPSSGDGGYNDFTGPATVEPYSSMTLLKSEPAPIPVDLRPPMRVLEQGEILLSDDPEQVRVLIEHNIKLKGTITDEMLEKVNRLLEHISADKCHCCGESIETAHKGDVHQCPQCGARCADKGTLARHMYTHTGLKPYTCEMCNKHFSRKYHLDRHVMQTGCDGKPKAAYPCQVCGKMFTRKDNLREHLRAHAGQVRRKKCYTCQYCEKQFYGSTLLQLSPLPTSHPHLTPTVPLHRRLHVEYVHEGKKGFECESCDKTFVRKEDLARHSVLHQGSRVHRCPICEKTFAIKPSLKIHLLTHTKEPPRSCEECGRAFIRQDCLLRHMRKKHREMLDQIMAEAEKKKIQQQLSSLEAVGRRDQLAADELEVRSKGTLSERALGEALRELLSLLVDEATLQAFGHPDQPVEQVLESVIRRCGHAHIDDPTLSYPDRLRENAKLLFTVVIDDNAVKTLLNSQTVDEVILHVLRLAKS
ncbi:Protein suppressor of hairy wing [Amphibalanus amphitrite]|uniref:Protein suppressor of hairy wing n=1 Tax=Amphibalanus amphitrite TaxID=1232801 RepID=A0A6A4X6G3_AMPAM|nr:Protein suppressor of hairy wing [Amphibalanus amphitrite]